MEWRRQLMSPELTEAQRENFKISIIKQIEEGSRSLDLDMIVRVPAGEQKGQRAHEENTGIVELFRQHSELQAGQDREKERQRQAEFRKQEALKHRNKRVGYLCTCLCSWFMYLCAYKLECSKCTCICRRILRRPSPLRF